MLPLFPQFNSRTAIICVFPLASLLITGCGTRTVKIGPTAGPVTITSSKLSVPVMLDTTTKTVVHALGEFRLDDGKLSWPDEIGDAAVAYKTADGVAAPGVIVRENQITLDPLGEHKLLFSAKYLGAVTDAGVTDEKKVDVEVDSSGNGVTAGVKSPKVTRDPVNEKNILLDFDNLTEGESGTITVKVDGKPREVIRYRADYNPKTIDGKFGVVLVPKLDDIKTTLYGSYYLGAASNWFGADNPSYIDFFNRFSIDVGLAAGTLDDHPNTDASGSFGLTLGGGIDLGKGFNLTAGAYFYENQSNEKIDHAFYAGLTFSILEGLRK